MLRKDDKDEIIKFLRARIQKIMNMADEYGELYKTFSMSLNCGNGPYNDFTEIYNIAEKTLNDTAW